MDESERILTYLHAKSRLRSEVIEISPFRLYLHLSSRDVDANVVLPSISHCEDVIPGLSRLKAFFERRNRIARIQFLDHLAPGLERTLFESGFTLDEKLPVLYCIPGQLCQQGHASCLQFTVLHENSSAELLVEALTLNALGFDAKATAVTSNEVRSFRRLLVRGQTFLAYLANVAVGTGMASEPLVSVAEIMGVTTLHAYRQQGIATALTAVLTSAAFQSGATLAFLVADSPEASRVYQRVGYHFCSHLVTFVG